MFTRKQVLPMRYAAGTTLSTEGVLFYQDGTCIQLGRDISIVPDVHKEKLISFGTDRVTEWILFHYQNNTYVTSMKVYTSVLDYKKQSLVGCEKYLFTKAIENLLQNTNMCRNDGLESAQIFRLKNAICADPVFESDEEEIFYNFDRVAYLDNQIEKLLISNNPYPLIPVVQDLICKKEVGAEILEDTEDSRYLDQPCPILSAVHDLTVPIVSYLAGATPIEKSVITQLSPYQYQPKLIKMLSSRVNENVTSFMQFKCPLLKKELSRALRLDEYLYRAIDTIDRDTMDIFSIKFDIGTNQYKVLYGENSYFHNMESGDRISYSLRDAFLDLLKWFNEAVKSIWVCKTSSEEIYIDVELPTGTHAKFYVDIPVFDLMAHNLI